MWLKVRALVCRLLGHRFGYGVIPCTITHTPCLRCWEVIDVRDHPRRAIGALGKEFERQIRGVGDKVKWEPWKNYGADVAQYTEPPCKACRFWKPNIQFFRDGSYSGVRLCQAEKQFHDFSCFESSKDLGD